MRKEGSSIEEKERSSLRCARDELRDTPRRAIIDVRNENVYNRRMKRTTLGERENKEHTK